MDRDGTTSLDNYLAYILLKLKFVCVYVFLCMCMCLYVLIGAYRCFKKEIRKETMGEVEAVVCLFQ